MTRQPIDIPLNKIIWEPFPAPSDGFVENIRNEGLRQPIEVAREGDMFRIRDGRRRAMAAKRLIWETIPGFVGEASDKKGAIVTLSLNLHRSPNIGSELKAVKLLMSDGSMKLDEIAKAIGISIQRMKKIYRLASLHDEAVALLERGAITEAVALQLSRLPRAKQECLLGDHGEKLPRQVVATAIREHSLVEAQPFLGEIIGELSQLDPVVIKFEELASIVMASGKVTSEVSQAVDTLRAFIGNELIVSMEMTAVA